MGKQPRKRRLGRAFDDIYGNGVRGKHISDPIYIRRTTAQHISDLKDYIASGSDTPPVLAWSLQNSSSLVKGLKLDMSGATRMGDYFINTAKDFSFACWAKPTDPAPVSQSLFVIAKTGSQGPYMAWFGLVSASSHTVKPRFAIISGSGGTSPTLEKFRVAGTTAVALGAWHFFGFSYDSGSVAATKVIVAADGNYNASLTAGASHAPLSASLKWEKTSMFVRRSGSATPDSGSSFHGYVNQAALWNSALTASQFTTIRNLTYAGNQTFVAASPAPKYAYNFGYRDSTTYATSYSTTVITASAVGGALSYVANGP